MKFIASTLALAAIIAVSVTANPDCQVVDTNGYGNCKSTFHVNGAGSDVLWCASEDDCIRVFPEAEIPEIPETTEDPDTIISAVEEQVSEASSSPKITKARIISGAVAAAASLMLC